ncbi:tripartite tricarboxylate transporter permease [Candidatus Formimonas warabiya]|nr:tripartite tricarboxylate transporter permease [Candidatus Formimonas warabiya]
MVIGCIIGLFIGALPALGDNIAIALLLPITLSLDPVVGIAMLMCIYQASEYGGSISSITLGIPGQGGAVCTMFDGVPMARRGEPGRALAISLTSSTVGGFFGVAALMFLTVSLMPLIYKLTDPEITCITAFGLLSIVCLNTQSGTKSLLSILLGLLVCTIGVDPFSGEPRFTFGAHVLDDGFSLVPVIIGLYAIPRIIESLVDKQEREQLIVDKSQLKFNFKKGDFRNCLPVMLLGSTIGTLTSLIPGLGTGPTTVFTYNICKSMKKHKDTFGTGDPRGIACVEAANNACVGGHLIPYLTMGIAGSGSIALIGGALVMHGIAPGATLMKNNPELVYGVMWGVLCSVILMFLFGIFSTRIFARIMNIPDTLMAPLLIFFSFAGSYVTRYMSIDIWICLGIGIAAYFAIKAGYSQTNFVVAFVLAKVFENSLRRSLYISHGDWSIFLTRKVCLVFVILMVGFVVLSVVRGIRSRRAIEESI